MTIEQALIYAKKEIHSDHAKILLGDLLNLNPLELLVHLNDEVPEDKMKIYTKEIEALKNNKPIQYVLGHINFYGQDYLKQFRELENDNQRYIVFMWVLKCNLWEWNSSIWEHEKAEFLNRFSEHDWKKANDTILYLACNVCVC